MITVREVENKTYVVSLTPGGDTSTRWCEVLGEPGVDLKKRGNIIVQALRLLQAAEAIMGRWL